MLRPQQRYLIILAFFSFIFSNISVIVGAVIMVEAVRGYPVAFLLLSTSFFFIFSTSVAFAAGEGEILPRAARVGVGVGLGKVELAEPLSSGGIYQLPALPVINTGLDPGTFQVQAELVKGPILAKGEGVKKWFRFSPDQFNLAPKESKSVAQKMALSYNASPGDYLVLLEAFQVRKSAREVLSPVAATKLYFTVRPSFVLGAFRARVLTFIETNPAIYLILASLLLIEAGFIFRRRFRVRIETR